MVTNESSQDRPGKVGHGLEEPREAVRGPDLFDAEEIGQKHRDHQKPSSDSEAVEAEDDEERDGVVEERQDDDGERRHEDESRVHDVLRQQVCVDEKAASDSAQEIEDRDDGQEGRRVDADVKGVSVGRQKEQDMWGA